MHKLTEHINVIYVDVINLDIQNVINKVHEIGMYFSV
jgi:hypothetical protein